MSSCNMSTSTSVIRTSLKRKYDEMIQERACMEPSWEILCLLGPYVDTETLCIASCSSTTWKKCFSDDDNLWNFKRDTYEDPSIFAAISETSSKSLSSKRLVCVVESAAKRSRKNDPDEPKIVLSDLVFIFNLSCGSKKATIVKNGKDLVFGSKECFLIEVDVSNSGFTFDMKEVKMVLHVVFKNYERTFTIIRDSSRSLEAKSGWLTGELRRSKNNSNLVGDVKLTFNGDVLEKVGFAILDSNKWDSLFVNDVLRYLQCFLLY